MADRDQVQWSDFFRDAQHLAYRGDPLGNLVYRKTTRNFNPMMATAARTTIAEVEQIVEAGALDPEAIVTPGIYVRYVVQGVRYEKRIERRTLRRPPAGA